MASAGYPYQQGPTPGYPPPQQGPTPGYPPPQQGVAPAPAPAQTETITLVPGQVQVISGKNYLVQANSRSRVWDNYAATTSKVLGGIIVASALLNILFNIIGIIIYQPETPAFDPFYVGHGFWGSLFFLLSGGFAIGAGRQKTTCQIVANLVLGIIAALIAGCGQISMSATGVGILAGCPQCLTKAFEDAKNNGDQEYQVIRDPYGPLYSYHNAKPRLALHAMMLTLSIIQMVAALWASGISCSAVCCGRRKRPQATYELVPTMMPPTSQVQLQQPGVMAPISQPGVMVTMAQPGVMAPMAQPQQPGAMAAAPPGQYYPPQSAQQHPQAMYPQLNAPSAPPTCPMPETSFAPPPAYNESYMAADVKVDLSK